MGTTTIRSSRIFAQKVSNRSGVEAETEAAQIFSFSFVNGAEVVMARLEECQSRRHAWKQKSREKQRSGKRRENLWDFEGIDLLQGHLELFQLHLDTKIQEKSFSVSFFEDRKNSVNLLQSAVLSTEGRVVGQCWEKLKPKGPIP